MANATQTPNKWVPRPEIRAWIYRVLAAVGPILVFYGIATAEEVALWLALGGTILSTGALALASANTPKS